MGQQLGATFLFRCHPDRAESWFRQSPDGPVKLDGLVRWLVARANEIEAANMQVKRVSVISIDFRPC